MSPKAKLDILPINENIAVIAGLGCGIAFIVIMATTIDSFGSFHFPETPDQFIRAASRLPEAQEFMNNYPSANTTFYRNHIVGFEFQGSDGRYSDLRVLMGLDGKPISIHLQCRILGDELNGIETHGVSLEGIATFLQEERCPATTSNID